MIHTRKWQWVAIGFAVLLLLLQIYTGLEALDGAPFSAKASIVAVMVTLAVLPKFTEVAARAGLRLLPAVLLVGFATWFIYSIPATVGRISEPRETKAAQAVEHSSVRKLVRDEYETAKTRLEAATADVDRKCAKSLASDNCREAKATEKDRQSRYDLLLNEVLSPPAAKPQGDAGSALLAWAASRFVSIDEATIRKVSVLSYALGLDILIWALVWFGTSERIGAERAQRPVVALVADTTNQPPPAQRVDTETGMNEDDSFRDLCNEIAAGRRHGVIEYSDRWRVSRGEASKRITSWEDQGMIGTERAGKFKLITSVRPRLIKAA